MSLVRTARAVVLAIALSALTAITPAPVHAMGPCGDAAVIVGAAAGTVNADYDMWFDNTTAVQSGSKLATLSVRGDWVDLIVLDGSCTSVCSASAGGFGPGTASCPLPDGPSYLKVFKYSCCTIEYVLTVTGGVPQPDEPPRLDDCDPATMCVGLFPGDVVETFPVVVPGIAGGANHDVAGSVDIYRFVLPGGGTVLLPCAVLTADATANPCGQAGGTFVSRFATLADQDVSEPVIGSGGAPLATIRICEATLVATVLGIGVESLPAFTVC